MPTWTKATIAVLEATVDSVPEAYVTETTNFVNEMAAQGKTDGIPEFLDMHTIKRVWLDQAAIDEWRAYCYPVNDTYGVVVTSAQIVDI
jgi:hypothetical protein